MPICSSGCFPASSMCALRGRRRQAARSGFHHPRRSRRRAARPRRGPFPPHRGDAHRDAEARGCRRCSPHVGVLGGLADPQLAQGAGGHPCRCRPRLDGWRTRPAGRHVALGLRAALFRSGGRRAGGISAALAHGARQGCAAPRPRHAGRDRGDDRLPDRPAPSAPPSATGSAARRATMRRSFAPARCPALRRRSLRRPVCYWPHAAVKFDNPDHASALSLSMSERTFWYSTIVVSN